MPRGCSRVPEHAREGRPRQTPKEADFMAEAFICDAARTPIGRYAGALAKVRTDDLAAVPIKALMARNPKVDWDKLDEVFYGGANQAGEENREDARAVRAGKERRSVRAHGRDFRLNNRLAFHQSADEAAIRRRFDAGDR